MQSALTIIDTTVGKKAALAVSGAVLFGFVIVHMLGNLQVYLGPDVFNDYAATLKSMPALLWGARAVLLAALLVHVLMMIQLYSRSNAARRVTYERVQSNATSYASATMKFTGPALGFYILFHLVHFTAPGLALGQSAHSPTDVYQNFVSSFQVPWVTALYVLANLFLSLHLFHGAWSLMQTLGLSHPRYNTKRKLIAQGLAAVVTVGNVVMPLSVLAGIVK